MGELTRARGVDLTECPGRSPAGRRPACASGARAFLRHSRPVIWSIDQDWRWEAFFAYDCPARCARRIRLVAYGARLESVLGASPRGFESPILRHRTPEPAQVPGFSLFARESSHRRGECCSNESRAFPLVMELEGNARGTKYEIITNAVWRPVGKLSCLCCLWRRWCSGRREACLVGLGCLVCPWAAARPRVVRAASLRLGASSRSPARPCRRPRALQPGPSSRSPARTRRPRGALHTGDARRAVRTVLALPPPTGTAACALTANRAWLAWLGPGLVPLNSESLDDLRSRECGEDLARHEQLRAAQARADAAPADRAG